MILRDNMTTAFRACADCVGQKLSHVSMVWLYNWWQGNTSILGLLSDLRAIQTLKHWHRTRILNTHCKNMVSPEMSYFNQLDILPIYNVLQYVCFEHSQPGVSVHGVQNVCAMCRKFHDNIWHYRAAIWRTLLRYWQWVTGVENWGRLE